MNLHVAAFGCMQTEWIMKTGNHKDKVGSGGPGQEWGVGVSAVYSHHEVIWLDNETGVVAHDREILV